MEPTGDSRGIIRLDQSSTGTRGWQVRVQRGGVRHTRYFPDLASGGAAKALEMARAWRDELVARMKDEDRARVCRTSARNSSGVVGVSRVTVQIAGGAAYHFWQASWSTREGRRTSVRFSVKRHGDDEAFRLAVLARREGTGF